MAGQTIYDSEHPAPVLPELSLWEFLFPDAEGVSPLTMFDKRLPAFIDGLDGRTISRGELEDNALRFTDGMRNLGYKAHDTVCLWGLNSLPWVETMYGCAAAGLCVSPANYAYGPHEIAHQINDSGATMIFIQPELLETFNRARPELKRQFADDRIVLLVEPGNKPKGLERFKCVKEIYGKRGHFERMRGVTTRETAWLCYSSGTTGLPKGVMTTNYNMTSQLQALNVGYQQLKSGKDSVLGILPFSHIYGLTIGLFEPISVGCPVVVLPRFEEISVLKAIQKHKITHGLVVPPVLIILLHSKNVQNYDISSIGTMMCGAAPLSPELTASFNKRYPGIKLTQGYGMTECSPTTHCFTGDEVEGRAGWIGRLLPTFQARLVQEDETDAPLGERGELWLRGPSVMKGYHNNIEATNKTMAPGGWYKTGDVLIRDEQGWYKVVDRVKELIKYKGFQVPPAELEGVLLQHPKVADAGVIGVWDEAQATELPRAYIVAVDGAVQHDADKAKLGSEVAAWLATRVARHKRLVGGVVVIDAIPKSPSGKILRKDLRVRAEEERERDRAGTAGGERAKL